MTKGYNFSYTLPKSIKEAYPFHSHYFNSPSGKMHYVDEGEGDEAVLMVHGNPTWSFYYRNLIKYLSPEIRCIAPDHIGCGLSERPRDFSYRLEDHIKNLHALIESLSLKKIHLIVHDWGGPIGLGVAQRMHPKVGNVVLLNTAAFPAKEIAPSINLCRMPLFGYLFIRLGNGFIRGLTSLGVEKPLPKKIKEGYLYPYKGLLASALRSFFGKNNLSKSNLATYRFVKDIPMSPSHPSFNTLEEIGKNLSVFNQNKLMICWGGKDFCFHDYFFKQWQNRFPAAECNYFDQAGHLVLEDASPLIEEIIANFLKK